MFRSRHRRLEEMRAKTRRRFDEILDEAHASALAAGASEARWQELETELVESMQRQWPYPGSSYR